ncbi:MAG TPA: hypothetical protein VGE55_11420 [Limnobacter sp.]|uniref:hypothetical protein n=1 Tax=Limnobacter sp. TaxID=2003368 RepID=UPI002EDA0E8A
MAGILISGLLSIGLLLLAVQSTTRANMDAYHAPNKVNIEVSNQLMQSGLRYGNHLLSAPNELWALFNYFAGDPSVTLTCQEGVRLPDVLVPSRTIKTLQAPSSNQEIQLKGVIAPYDCNQPLDDTNYRLTFEIVGAVSCNSGNQQLADSCTARSVVLNAYKGVTFNPVYTPPVVTVKYECPTGPFVVPAPDIMAQIEAACAAIGVTLTSYDGPPPPGGFQTPTTTTTVTDPGTTVNHGNSQKKHNVGS